LVRRHGLAILGEGGGVEPFIARDAVARRILASAVFDGRSEAPSFAILEEPGKDVTGLADF
jgi:hypothetical protein